MSAGVRVSEDVMGACRGGFRLGERLVGDAKGSAEDWASGIMEGVEEQEGVVRTMKRAGEWIVGEETVDGSDTEIKILFLGIQNSIHA